VKTKSVLEGPLTLAWYGIHGHPSRRVHLLLPSHTWLSWSLPLYLCSFLHPPYLLTHLPSLVPQLHIPAPGSLKLANSWRHSHQKPSLIALEHHVVQSLFTHALASSSYSAISVRSFRHIDSIDLGRTARRGTHSLPYASGSEREIQFFQFGVCLFVSHHELCLSAITSAYR
jgi:hypothetical protein